VVLERIVVDVEVVEEEVDVVVVVLGRIVVDVEVVEEEVEVVVVVSSAVVDVVGVLEDQPRHRARRLDVLQRTDRAGPPGRAVHA